jgi:ribosome-binding factor A
MCRQVQRRLDMALGSELSDPSLQGLWVEDVTPVGTGSSLLVRVIVPDATRVARVMQQLDAAKGYLRSEIASAIHRKRTPHLQFIVLPQAALTLPEEDDDER